jgi:hypothetical protein
MPEPERREPSPRGPETILPAEDEEPVRRRKAALELAGKGGRVDLTPAVLLRKVRSVLDSAVVSESHG